MSIETNKYYLLTDNYFLMAVDIANQTKPYSLWIHCNRCYEIFITKRRKFFLLACQNVACELCQTEVKQNVNGPKIYKCPTCFKITRAAEIDNTMPKNLKELFHPEPFVDGLNHFQIIKFQVGHRDRYVKHLERSEYALREQWKAIEKVKELCKMTFQNHRQRKMERRQEAKRVLAIKQQVRELDGNSDVLQQSLSSSSSSATSSIKARKTHSNPGNKTESITTFSDLNPRNSFVL